jgi:hypothetical protein
VTSMEEKSVSRTLGAPSARSMLKSFALHVLVLALLMLVPMEALRRTPNRNKQIDVVFYRPPQIAAPAPAVSPPPAAKSAVGSPPKAPAIVANLRLDLPPGPEAIAPVEPQRKVGNVGILAFKDKIASLAHDNVAPRLGADARYGAADNGGRPSSGSMLTSNAPGSSGGINVASLNHSVGGGGGAGGGGGIQGVSVGRATSTIGGTGGGDRPKARGGPGPSRTDEEIQIVFDRYKASFYRLYNRELRNNPTLQGQMVLRLTIEPDGSVSMCALQSSDMDAPDLGAQVVSRVKTMNFGAKEGVQAVTIVYPIDFLPAA